MICNYIKVYHTVNNEKFRELLHFLGDKRHRFPRNRTGIQKNLHQNVRKISVWTDGLRISGLVILVAHTDQHTPAVTSCNGTLWLNPLNAELNPIWHLLALLGAYHIFHISRMRVYVGKLVILSGQVSSEIKPFIVKKNEYEVHFFVVYIRLPLPQNSLFVTICSVEFLNHIGLVWIYEYMLQFGCSSCWYTQTRSSVVQVSPNIYWEMSPIYHEFRLARVFSVLSPCLRKNLLRETICTYVVSCAGRIACDKEANKKWPTILAR
jgi:hypothetical protein